jgi:hypothetical protein
MKQVLADDATASTRRRSRQCAPNAMPKMEEVGKRLRAERAGRP